MSPQKLIEMFLVIYRPGPMWDPNKSVTEQQLEDHNKYLSDLHRHRTLSMAGPFTDDWGVGVVIVTADRTLAESLVKNDPGVVSGVLVYNLHPWSLVLH